jgi:hypothetical protein
MEGWSPGVSGQEEIMKGTGGERKADPAGLMKRVFQGYNEALQGLKKPTSSLRRVWTESYHVSVQMVGQAQKRR